MRLLPDRALRPITRLTVLIATTALVAPVAVPDAAASTRAATGATSTAASAAAGTALTDVQAVAQAKRTGKPVPVPARTTATSTVTANPNGTLSLTENAVPVRKLVGNAWQPLDATLVKNADGTLSPKLADSSLRLSGGGGAPLATLASGIHSLTIKLPITLPAPTLSGATATYHDVAPGIDLAVTATTLGSVSDVLVVKNAAAAASPALNTLLTATVAGNGLNVSADRDGNLTAATRTGVPVFAAAAPALWDSAGAPGPAVRPLTSAEGAAAQSSIAAPGAGAHTGRLTPRLTGHTLTLSPDRSVLGSGHPVYPVFIDPTWGPVSKTAWSTVAQAFSSQYWNKSVESAGYMAAGYTSDLIAVRTLINFPVPTSTLSGATISSAMFYIWNTYSGGCLNSAENQILDIDAPSTTLSASNAYWADWNGSQVGSRIGYQSFSYGYSAQGIDQPSSCTTGGAPVGIGLNTGTFAADASAGKTTQTLALVAENQSDIWGWKLLDPTTAKLTFTYNHAPTITSMASNSSTACSSAKPGLLGRGSVYLTAGVYDADGDSLNTYFSLYNSGKTTQYNPASTNGGTTGTPSKVPATTGTKATLVVPLAFFTGLGITKQTTFLWTVYDNDGTTNSVATSSCYFTYDPTSPGEPTVTDAAGYTCPSSTSTQTYTIGTAASFTLTDTDTNGGTVGSYTYQLNNAAPITATVPSGAASPYTASITLKPTRGTDILTVTAVSGGGNLGDTHTCIFQAATTSSSDKDLTGDGQADLLTVGTASAPMAAGLWLAPGQNTTGTVATTPTDIGINGDGVTADNSAADFTGTQAITGEFTARGLQDVLVYHPTGGRAGEADIYDAPGDGSPLLTQYSGNESTLTAGTLIDSNNDSTPLQLANAYNAAGSTLAYPDLLGISGDSTNGYDLTYYPNGDGSAAFGKGYYVGSYNNSTSTFTALPTPTGGTDWNNWTLATAQTNGNTWIFLWNSGATGSKPLYLWQNFTVGGYRTFGTGTSGGCTAKFGPDLCTASGFTQYQVSGNWNPGTLQTLEAADFDNDTAADLVNPQDKIPDLWAVTTSGTVTPYTVSHLDTTPTITADTSQNLTTATHTWALNDNTTDSNGNPTAADNTTSTPLPLSSTGNATWNTSDEFNPDIQYDGTNGHLYTTTKAVTLTGSFTVSAWVNPTVIGRVALSQDGSAYSGFLLYPTGTGWEFALNTGSGTAGNWDVIIGGTVQLGAWTHLTANYDVSNHVMSLYVDDVFVAYGSHAVPGSGASGPFQIGADRDNSNPDSFFAGQIAQVQAWDGTALAPAQPYTPGAYHQALTPTRILDTRGTNVQYSNNPPSTPAAPFSTTTLQITGDSVTTAAGASAKIPSTATAVSVDVTAVAPTGPGFITTYADGTQRPVTSSTNFTPGPSVTGYQIVPLGLDGKIALYNSSTGSTQLIVDITGYFTTETAPTGTDQTYHTLDPAQRALATAGSIANTTGLSGPGRVPANTTFTLQVAGPTVPANATAVALNLITYSQTTGGYLAVYPTGASVGPLTSLTYQTADMAQTSADVPIGTGGKISIYNYGGAADIIVDIAGYYTSDTTGDLYHTANPTRLVDTRDGVGGPATTITATKPYTIQQAAIDHVTTLGNAIPATILTVTDTVSAGNLVAYGTNQPGTNNVNWTNAGTTVANLALPPLSSAGTINIAAEGSGSIDLVVDSSGYFTTN